MKNIKLFLSLALAIALIVPSFANAELVGDFDPQGESSCIYIQNNLRYRSTDAQTGGEVSVLQDYLQATSYLDSSPTGFFGLLTFGAVKKFQTASGIEPTGFVGPLTRGRINLLTCGTPGNPVPPPIAFPSITPCSAGALFNNQTGVRCPSSSTPSVQPSINISWSNGKNKVQLGLVDSRFDKDGAVLGWISLYESPTGSLTWYGQNVGDLSGTVNWPVTSLSKGPFRILALTSSPNGNYCWGYASDDTCNYVLSNYFSITNHRYDITIPPFASETAPQPTITSISPNSGQAGDTITIYGANFNPYTFVALEGNYGPSITPTSIGATSLTFVIPSNTTPGTHTVQVNERGRNFDLSNSVSLFVVNPPVNIVYQYAGQSVSEGLNDYKYYVNVSSSDTRTSRYYVALSCSSNAPMMAFVDGINRCDLSGTVFTVYPRVSNTGPATFTLDIKSNYLPATVNIYVSDIDSSGVVIGGGDTKISI